jgi:hypothetical protein
MQSPSQVLFFSGSFPLKEKESAQLECNEKQTKLRTGRRYIECLPSGSIEPHESRSRGRSVILTAEARWAGRRNKATWIN